MRSWTDPTLLETTSKLVLDCFLQVTKTLFVNRYNQWSPPAQSNESSNGYFLERSNSARITLEKSIELCPEEEPDCEDNVNRELSSGISNLTVGSNSSDSNGDADSAPTAPSDGDPLSAKSHFPLRGGTVQPRPGHAHLTSPRVAAPVGSQTMPRSTPQTSLVNPNRVLSAPPKNDGGANNGNQSNQPPANN